MPLERSEEQARLLVRAIHEDIEPEPVESTDAIRGAALQMFTKALDAKLANLQDGESLLLTFRIDISRADGSIRGGSGYDRNMPEYAEWRDRVFQRDGYACRDCGARGDLQAHHIKPWAHYPDERFDDDNGMTLCAECHAKRHPHLRMMRHGTS